MTATHMHLKVLLPFQIFADRADVLRIVAQTRTGSFGLLPQRLDCVAALVPGILLYETAAQGELCAAVDEGVLVKAGADVFVSVRRAHGAADLAQLRESVEQEFLAQDEQKQNLHEVMAKLESGFLHRLASLRHE